MKGFEQGDIHYAHFDDPIKSRPVVVLSRTDLNMLRTNIVVALITGTIRGIPYEVSVGIDEGLSKDSVVDLGDIHTLPKTRFSERKGGLSPDKIDQLREGLKLLFALT